MGRISGILSRAFIEPQENFQEEELFEKGNDMLDWNAGKEKSRRVMEVNSLRGLGETREEDVLRGREELRDELFEDDGESGRQGTYGIASAGECEKNEGSGFFLPVDKFWGQSEAHEKNDLREHDDTENSDEFREREKGKGIENFGETDEDMESGNFREQEKDMKSKDSYDRGEAWEEENLSKPDKANESSDYVEKGEARGQNISLKQSAMRRLNNFWKQGEMREQNASRRQSAVREQDAQGQGALREQSILREQSTLRELGRIVDISTVDIVPNPNQPRKHFAVDELTSLAKSISENGIVQPLTVRRIEGGFELVSGERRLRAAKLAGLRSVPCIVIKADSGRSAVMALIENIQRADLNCFEEAGAIAALIDSGEITREEVSMKLGLAQSTIANKLRLLKLTGEEQDIICRNNLSERHARALLKVADTDKRKEILMKAVEGGWTVDATEKYILRLEREDVKKSSYEKRSVMLKDVRLFFNSVNKALEVMKLAGVEADAKRINHKDYIEYIIKIPSGEVNSANSGKNEELP